MRRLDAELEANLRAAINVANADTSGTASHERASMIGEIDFLRGEIVRHSHLWCEARQDNDLLSEAVRGLLRQPDDANAIKFAKQALGARDAEV